MKTYAILAAAAAMTLTAGPAFAQSTEPGRTQRDRLGDILGTLFGDRSGATGSLEAQWAAGRTPLTNQRSQFESRVDTEIRSGAMSQAVGQRLISDYAALVQLEGRYGADGRFTTLERNDLADRYGALTQVLADRGYADGGTAATATADVAEGRADFDARVNAAVTARRITRVQGTRLKSDYAALVQVESNYLRDGAISASERDDLDARLDALDDRLGDSTYATPALTARARLDAVLRALPASGLSAAAQAQLRVEHGDLSRLEAAYTRLTPTADERAYLERRLQDLETRARVRR
jgi:hypothetical protein